jgi:type I restriction-modification system DNA methylase subunit
METTAKKPVIETTNTTPWSRKLYRNAGEFWEDSKELHHWYTVYRTLAGEHDDFKPDAVFYVGKSPSAYLIETEDISEENIRRWQRFLWNQTVVPILVVKAPTKINVYTAYTKPQKSDSQEKIVSILKVTADTLELEKLWIEIEAGTIYEERPDLFKRQYAVDRFLLDNLNAAANQIAKTQAGNNKQKNLTFAHTFLTRLLFVCYLIERGMIKGSHFDDKKLQKLRPKSKNNEGYFLRHLFDDLSTYSQRRDALCRIFARVKDRFNGSLFPDTITKEKERYNNEFIRILNTFLNGHDLKGSQLTLDFWAYDFSVIPIETISAVYESFIGQQGKIKESLGEIGSKRSSGAYYTPLHLAELTVDMALKNNEKPIHELKVFDPACGSGVFLVSLFGRMADSLRRKENYKEKNLDIKRARKMLPLLSKLYGIDISHTACHITCFSLYLALLEQLTPMDVEYLFRHNERLPALLATATQGYKTVHHGNLFDPELSFKEKDFDLVIGNPPWVSRKNQKDKHFLGWIKSRGKNKINILGPDKQIAHGFMWKAPGYLSDTGVACFLLPTSVLLNNHTNKFQKEWLQSVTVDRVVNFSDLRFVLFENAVHPCVAIRFAPLKSKLDDMILYESPKTDIRSQQGGPVYTREEDTVNLQLKDIFRAAKKGIAPTIWKTHYWGSWRDRRLLSRLMDLPKLDNLAGEVDKNKRWIKRWIKGQGIQISGGDDNPVWWKPSTPYLDSNTKFDLAICKHDLLTVKKAGIPTDTVHRPRPKQLFAGPKVLLSKGSRKAIFCSGTVLFKDTFTAIRGNSKDGRLLRFLTAVLGSDLAYYYLFHTNSNLGIYRPQTYPKEFLSIPFFLPNDASNSNKAQKIVDEVSGIIEGFEKRIKTASWFGEEQRRKDEAERIRRDIEPLVREYYNIDKYEAMLIEDTLQLAVKSFHPRQKSSKIPTTFKHPEDSDCIIYAQTLCEMLNNFGRGSQFKVKGDIIKGRPYSIVHVAMTNRITRTIPVSTADEKLTETFNRMKTLLQHEQDRFVFCQNLKVFDGNSLYILKPMQMRFWSRTAALNDADEIAGSIIQSQRGR